MSFAKSLKTKLASIALASMAFAGLTSLNAAPASAAVNPASEVIFFDQGAGHLGLKRMRFDGTGKSTYNILSLIASPDIRTQTSDGTKLFFVNNGDGVYSMNLDGTSLTKISTAVPSDLVIYGSKIYYTSWSGGVSSMNLDGTGATLLAAASTFPGASSTGIRNLYVDGTYIWITHGTGGGGTDGHVYRVAIAGGTPALAYTDVGSAGVNGIAGSGDNIFIRSGNNGKLLGLSRTSLITGTQTAPASELYANNQGSEVELAGTKLYVTTNVDIFELDLASYVQSSPALLPATSLALGTAFASANPRSMVVFAAKTVSFDSNGGAGAMTAQSSAFDISLNANTFTRDRHVFSYWYTNNTCSTGGTVINGGSLYSPTADTTLYACWRGAVAVSLTSGGSTIDTYDFGNVAVGSTNSVTIYLSNIGDANARPLSFSNGSVSTGVGLSLPGTGTCNFSGGSLNIGTPCTVIVTWSPVSASTLHSNSESLVFQASANYTIGFSGAAVALKTVTFNANNGVGTMSNQTGVSSQNLTTGSFTRSGYTFAGWNTQADGSGSSFTDGGTYNFSNTITLYAQWTLIPVAVTPVAPNAPPTPSGPTVTGTLGRVFTEESPQVMTIQGSLFNDLESVTVNGNLVKVLEITSESIRLDLGALSPGTYSVYFKFKAGSLIYQDAIIVKAKQAAPNGNTGVTAHKAIEKLLAGFVGDSHVLTSALKAKLSATLKKLPTATNLVCTGSTSNSKVTAADRRLAKARAEAACTFAKQISPALQTKIAVNPSSGVTATARNVLLKLSN